MARKKKSKVQPLVVKIILTVLLVGGIIGAVGFGAVYLFRHNDYFRVRSVVIDPSLQFVDKRDLRNLLGKNIFDVDLKAVQRRLSYKYPQASNLKVAKRFPNRIAVVAKQRLPFAQIKSQEKVVVLDGKGVVLSVEEKEDKDLPSIMGAKLSGQRIVRGLPLHGADLRIALEIAQGFQSEKSLSSYTIKKINIGNLSKIYFTLSNGLNVITDREKVSQRVRILGVVLAQGQLDLKEVKYVDLRFKEPIIGKK